MTVCLLMLLAGPGFLALASASAEPASPEASGAPAVDVPAPADPETALTGLSAVFDSAKHHPVVPAPELPAAVEVPEPDHQAPPTARPLGPAAEPGPVTGRVHPPITIIGDAGFLLPGSGVTSGMGTADDPYVIEGWTFVLPDARGPAILLRDTTKHVILRDNRVVALTNDTADLEFDLARRVYDRYVHNVKPHSEFSIHIEASENVSLIRNTFNTMRFDCTSCLVEGNTWRFADSYGLVDSVVRGNTLVTLHVTDGSGNVILDNLVPEWDWWAYPFKFSGGSLERFEGNTIRGYWQMGLVVECDEDESVLVRGNDFRIENTITNTVLDFYKCGEAIVDGNSFHRGSVRARYTDAYVLSNNSFHGNSVYALYTKRVIMEDNRVEAGTTIFMFGDEAIVRDNVFVARAREGYVHRLVIDRFDHAVAQGNSFDAIGHHVTAPGLVRANTYLNTSYLRLDGASTTVEENAFRDGNGVFAFDGGRDHVIRANVFENVTYGIYLVEHEQTAVADNRIDGGTFGLYAQDSTGLDVTGNRFGNMDEAIVLAYASTIRLTSNQVTGDGASIALWGSERAHLDHNVTGTSVDHRPVVRLDACSASRAAGAARYAAYLILVDCAPVSLTGSYPQLLGIAAWQTPLTLESVALSPAMHMPLAIAGADTGASGLTVRNTTLTGEYWSLIAFTQDPVELTGSRFDTAGAAIVGAERARVTDTVFTDAFLVLVEGRDSRVDSNVASGLTAFVSFGGERERFHANSFRDCIVGVYLASTESATVSDNEMAACAHGILASGNMTATRNVVTSGPDREGVGIGIKASHATGASRVDGNVVHGFAVGVLLDAQYGVTLPHEITRNVITHARGIALMLTHPADARIQGNDLSESGIGLYLECMVGSRFCRNTQITNNSVHANADFGVYIEDARPHFAGNAVEGNGLGLFAILPRNQPGYLPVNAQVPEYCHGKDNWWGSPEGPNDETAHPTAGDSVECWVNYGQWYWAPVPPAYAGWLTAPPEGLLASPVDVQVDATPSAPRVGENVTFTANATPVLFAFGDGHVRAFSDDATGVHAYEAAGTRTAWAVTRAPTGELGWASTRVEVAP